jgi:hypothetical protein
MTAIMQASLQRAAPIITIIVVVAAMARWKIMATMMTVSLIVEEQDQRVRNNIINTASNH